jgi:hypothetical protein
MGRRRRGRSGVPGTRWCGGMSGLRCSPVRSFDRYDGALRPWGWCSGRWGRGGDREPAMGCWRSSRCILIRAARGMRCVPAVSSAPGSRHERYVLERAKTPLGGSTFVYSKGSCRATARRRVAARGRRVTVGEAPVAGSGCDSASQINKLYVLIDNIYNYLLQHLRDSRWALAAARAVGA